MSQFAIEVEGLVKDYNKGKIRAVNGLSFRVAQGVCFGLLGPNGAGKSTTLEILQGGLVATRGSVRIHGLTYAKNERAIRARIGGILQHNRFFDRLTVEETLRLFASFYEKPLLIREVLERVGLLDLKGRWLKDLSGGERQRVFIGTAIIGNPDLVFLDEPSTGLDPLSRQGIWSVLRKLKEQGTTIVLTTHAMEEAELLCDQILIVDQGKGIAQGSPEELIAENCVDLKISQKPNRASLNDVFIALTGKHLNEGG